MPEKRAEFPIEIRLREDMKQAMKARDQVKVDTLRMAMTAIRYLEVARTDVKNPEYGQPMTEADCYKVLEQEVKKRNQAIALYEQGGRAELVAKEQSELATLQTYLQAAHMDDEEVRTLVSGLIEENGKEFRRIMPLAIKATRGKADGGRVQRIVKELTQ